MDDSKPAKTAAKYEGVATSVENPDSPEAKLAEKPPYRMLQTVCLQLAWICVGIFSEISGPTLTFLKARISVDYEEMSRALVARSVGFLVGSLLGGFLCQRWARANSLWVAIALVVGGVTTGFQPWSNGLVTLAVLFFLDGFAKGVVCTVANAAVFILWKLKAAVPTHVMHCCYGIGALVVPQVARPFLPDPKASNGSCRQEDINATGPLSADNLSGVSDPGCTQEEHIEYPYIIVGVCAVLGAVLVFAVHCIVVAKSGESGTQVRVKKDQGQKTMEIIRQNKCLAFVLLGLFAILWALPVGEERAFGKFIFAFATDSQQQFPPKQASDLVMVFWVTFTGGRALAALLSRWLSPLRLLSIELLLGVISGSVLLACGHNQPIALWACTAVFAATLSPIFPAAMTWTNLHIPMTAVLTSFAFIATASGAMSFSYISGYLFQYTGPRSLMYLSLAYVVTSAALVVVITIIIRVRPLHKGDEDEQEESEEEEEKMEMTTDRTTSVNL